MRLRPLMVLTASALAAALIAAPLLDKVNITRKFKVGEVETYSIDAKIGDGMGFKGKLTVKALSTPEGKPTEVEINVLEAAMEADGQANDLPRGEKQKQQIDSAGFPAEFEVSDGEVIGAIYYSNSLVPGKEVEVGQPYKISWQSKSGAKIEGNGKVTKLKDVEGKKIAFLSYQIEVTPHNDTPAQLNVESQVEVETGKLISAETSAQIEGQDVKMTVKAVKS